MEFHPTDLREGRVIRRQGAPGLLEGVEPSGGRLQGDQSAQ